MIREHDLIIAGLDWRRSAVAELERRAARDVAIRAASDAGLTERAIAAAVGIDPGAVHRIITGQRGTRARR